MTTNDSVLFNVDIDNFSGSLDTLLDLAKAQKVNLEDISITKLADQFYEYISNKRDLNKIIPLSKLYEDCENLYNSIEIYCYQELPQGFEFYNTLCLLKQKEGPYSQSGELSAQSVAGMFEKHGSVLMWVHRLRPQHLPIQPRHRHQRRRRGARDRNLQCDPRRYA